MFKEGSERSMSERTDSALLVSVFGRFDWVLLRAMDLEVVPDTTILRYLSYPRTEWLHILSQPRGCLKY